MKFAFENSNQGDLFVKKAQASTLEDLTSALLELFDRRDHEVKVIGWRHSEKLYETLASAQELARSEDMGDYYCIKLDGRDLNYKAYFSEGQGQPDTYDDYHSHNTERLNVDGVKDLLLSLPEVQAELQGWN